MTPGKLFTAILYPLTQSSVLIPLVVFGLLVSFAQMGGVLGLFLMFLVLPAVFRFQMILLEARAHGREPATPDVEFFNWFGNVWSLFPVVLAILAVLAVNTAAEEFGIQAAFLVLLLASTLLPASLAILAITHSPLQSLNPVAYWRLFNKCGSTLWIASVYMVAMGWLISLTESLPLMLANMIQLLLSFSVFSLIGSLMEPYGLMEDISIPNAVVPDEKQLVDDVERARIAALGHAYVFISRDNREGGFKHVFDSIEADPDPAGAWAWYFERMLGWEDQTHVLFFAQRYIHDMLQHGEALPALKAIMRCRLIDEQFRPLREDMPAAIAAAESSGNNELSAVLKRS